MVLVYGMPGAKFINDLLIDSRPITPFVQVILSNGDKIAFAINVKPQLIRDVS